MNYQQPERLNMSLDDFADLERKVKSNNAGWNVNFNNIPFPEHVVISDFDDACGAIEQDYYLSKHIKDRLEYLAQDDKLRNLTCALVSRYLSSDAESEHPDAIAVKQQAINLLRVI